MKYYEFLKYSRYIRYGVFWLTMFLMIFSVKIYLNNFSIESNISHIKTDTQLEYQQLYFKDNFYKWYLTGSFWKFFMQHENNITLPWELVIRFSKEDLAKTQQTQTWAALDNVEAKEKIINITEPKEAWKYFLSEKLSKIKETF